MVTSPLFFRAAAAAAVLECNCLLLMTISVSCHGVPVDYFGLLLMGLSSQAGAVWRGGCFKVCTDERKAKLESMTGQRSDEVC